MTEKKIKNTEKIYEKDSAVSVFNAAVVSCEKEGENYRVILDRTAFFPTGGGQSCDTGMLDNARVSDVCIENGEIIHLTSSPLTPGQTVVGTIAFTERLSKMRSHTAEHILSAFLFALKGYTNVGFHLGSLDTTCDFNGYLTENELNEAEFYVNSVIMENIPVYPSFPSENELKTLSYRSKLELEDDVRIVNIGKNGEIDRCACCAPHVKSTGQIGFFKITDAYHYKGGTRIHILTGVSAVKRAKDESACIRTLSAMLSAKPYASDVAEAVNRVISELSDTKALLGNTRDTLASAYCIGASADKPFVLHISEPDSELVKRIALRAINNGALSAFVFGGENDCRFALAGDGAADRFNEMRYFFSARGGGKDVICGSVKWNEGLIGEG